MLRILKLLRLLKLMRMFQSLWNLISGFITATKQLFWVLVLLFTVIYAGSVFTTVTIGYQCGDEYADWELCEDHFGSILQSMYSLFQAMRDTHRERGLRSPHLEIETQSTSWETFLRCVSRFMAAFV